MKMFFVLAVIVCLAAACAIPLRPGPSQDEVNAADCGPVPINCEAAIQRWIKENLRDPAATQVEGIGQPEKTWWGQTGGLAVARDIKFGWVVTAKINAKNGFGGYIGFKKYLFCFRDGEIKYTQFER